MFQVILSANTEHFVVYGVHVFERDVRPTGGTEVLVKMIEEPLHMVRNTTAQTPAHVPAHFGMQD